VRPKVEQSNTPEMVLPIQSGENLATYALLVTTGFEAVKRI